MRGDIKDIPSGETRARPEILGKHLVHSDSGTKAKGGTGTRRNIKDIPSGETRAHPEILGKQATSFTRITMVSVCRIRAFMRAQSLWVRT
jgi:hypothetical protein